MKNPVTRIFSLYRGLSRSIYILFGAHIVNRVGSFVYPFLHPKRFQNPWKVKKAEKTGAARKPKRVRFSRHFSSGRSYWLLP